ncbi:MAG: metal-sensitive transcriptional regulator [Dehalococcoidia bacterium]|nr:metal-sensitive transcriptional regulator [Dehalococcoidia bacterium]
MQDSTRAESLKRLRYIEGHLNGVRRMIEEDAYCVDILKQSFAVRRAIEKLEQLMLEGHLRTCVVEGIRDGREEQVVGELRELYELANK